MVLGGNMHREEVGRWTLSVYYISFWVLNYLNTIQKWNKNLKIDFEQTDYSSNSNKVIVILIWRNARSAWKKNFERHSDKSIKAWQKKRDVTKKGSILVTIPSLGFSHQLWKHSCLAGYCELRKSASKQCGIHFRRKFPRPWVWLPLRQTHHQILSACWEQSCLSDWLKPHWYDQFIYNENCLRN